MAYGIGFAASIPFFSVPGLYVGPVAERLSEADIALFVGLPVSALVYLALSRSAVVPRGGARTLDSEAQLASP